MNYRPATFAFIISLQIIFCTGVAAEDRVYQYQDNDGRVVFTDRRHNDIKLVKITSYGRPTAKVSCNGISAKSMKKRIDKYRNTINKFSWKHGVSPKLVTAVINTESCFDHKAVSRVGAQGLMQLMPATAKDLGVKNS